MNTFFCILLWVVIPVIILVTFIKWVTETRQERVTRWNKSGISQTAISKRLGISRYQVRKMLA